MKITSGALLDMLTVRPDSAICFLSALKEQERQARTGGQPVWVKLGNQGPERRETQCDRPAYTVRILK